MDVVWLVVVTLSTLLGVAIGFVLATHLGLGRAS